MASAQYDKIWAVSFELCRLPQNDAEYRIFVQRPGLRALWFFSDLAGLLGATSRVLDLTGRARSTALV